MEKGARDPKEMLLYDIEKEAEKRGYRFSRGPAQRRWEFSLRKDNLAVNGIVRAGERARGPWHPLSTAVGLDPEGGPPFQCIRDLASGRTVTLPFDLAKRYSWVHGTSRSESFELVREGSRFRIHRGDDHEYVDAYVDDWDALFHASQD